MVVPNDAEAARVRCDGCRKQTIVFERKHEQTKLDHVRQTCTHECSECGYQGIICNINNVDRLVNPADLY